MEWLTWLNQHLEWSIICVIKYYYHILVLNIFAIQNRNQILGEFLVVFFNLLRIRSDLLAWVAGIAPCLGDEELDLKYVGWYLPTFKLHNIEHTVLLEIFFKKADLLKDALLKSRRKFSLFPLCGVLSSSFTLGQNIFWGRIWIFIDTQFHIGSLFVFFGFFVLFFGRKLLFWTLNAFKKNSRNQCSG